MTKLTKEIVTRSIAHLDAASQAAVIELGRAIYKGEKPRVRIAYTPKTSSRVKTLVMDMVGDNEYVGVVVAVFASKAGNLCLRMLDYAREEVQYPGQPVKTTLAMASVTNVVLLRPRDEEPTALKKEAAKASAPKATVKSGVKEPTVFSKACKRCSKSGLGWIEAERGWRLVDRSGNMHRCTPSPVSGAEPRVGSKWGDRTTTAQKRASAARS